jgi:cobalamin biosynthesis Mg chelatase CobN
MGVASSKNSATYSAITSALSETMSSQLISIAQQSVSSAASTQLINITVSAGQDVNISDISQKAVINVDVKKFLSSISSTDLGAMMTNALQSAARNDQTTNNQLTLGGSMITNGNKTEVNSTTVNRVVSSYNYSQFVSDVTTILSSQTIDISAVANRNVNISNVSQFIKIELLSTQIAKAMAKTIMDVSTSAATKSSNTLSQSATSGFSLGIVLIVIVIVVLVGGAIFWLNGGSEIVSRQLNPAGQFMGRGIGRDDDFMPIDDDFVPV